MSEIELSSIMSPVGLNPNVSLSYADVEFALANATVIITGSKWLRGDLLNYAEDKFGVDWAQLIPDSTVCNKGTLMNEKSISKRVPVRVRRVELSHSHHAAVAPLNGDEKSQIKWLDYAVENNLTREELRAHIANRALNNGMMQLVLPPKSYTRDEVKSAFNQLLLHVDRNDETAEILDLCIDILKAMNYE